MILNIKILIKEFLFLLIDLCIFKNKSINKKTILIVRLDAIGDYILFRNFIECLQSSKEYAEYNITLCGNIAWQPIAKELDDKFIDNFIWINRSSFNRNLLYRYKKLKELSLLGYEVIFSPTYSREFFFNDNIIKVVSAWSKIGSSGNTANMPNWQKKISDKYYTKLLPASDDIVFEFNRNKEFFEYLLKKKLYINKPNIILNNKMILHNIADDYCILFIGASHESRKWNIEKFAIIAQYLQKRYNQKIVLCGATEDLNNAIKFKEYFSGDYIDLVGKTSLLELLYLIKGTSLLITNETSCHHMAVALNVRKIIVIYNGSHYGRFIPYPIGTIANYSVVSHPDITKDLLKYKTISNKYGYKSTLIIDEITTSSVIKAIDEVLE